VTPPNIPGNWKLDWSDEFNDTSLDGWKTNIWWGSSSGMGDERTSPNNVSVSGGNLNLTATKSGTSTYTSGLVTSDDLHEFQCGYVEAKMDIPSGIGFWPAFWMLPGNHDDGLGEIDIMEVVGGDAQLHVNYHVDGPGDDAESDHPGTDLFSGFHTYGVNWQKDSITWYIDGKEFHKTTNYTHTPMYVILNLAVGGDWPGSPNGQTPFPSTMKVDYVRVWENAA
jgi:beta-glucanase (GH16 family)